MLGMCPGSEALRYLNEPLTQPEATPEPRCTLRHQKQLFLTAFLFLSGMSASASHTYTTTLCFRIHPIRTGVDGAGPFWLGLGSDAGSHRTAEQRMKPLLLQRGRSGGIRNTWSNEMKENVSALTSSEGRF